MHEFYEDTCRTGLVPWNSSGWWVGNQPALSMGATSLALTRCSHVQCALQQPPYCSTVIPSPVLSLRCRPLIPSQLADCSQALRSSVSKAISEGLTILSGQAAAPASVSTAGGRSPHPLIGPPAGSVGGAGRGSSSSVSGTSASEAHAWSSSSGGRRPRADRHHRHHHAGHGFCYSRSRGSKSEWVSGRRTVTAGDSEASGMPAWHSGGAYGQHVRRRHQRPHATASPGRQWL
jgi:hypothetical protein